jgi:hypothetical protein
LSYARVQAVQRGQYGGIFRDVGDVFDIQNAADFSSSAVNYGSIATPNYGWMLQVPSLTPLYSYALANGGNSTLVQGMYSANSQGVVNLSIPPYVV